MGEIRNPAVCGWTEFSSGNAKAAVSVRSPVWNYITALHEEGGDRLHDLVNFPLEDYDVRDPRPGVVKMMRRQVEAPVGQPIPARLNEVCNPGPSPIGTYMKARKTSLLSWFFRSNDHYCLSQRLRIPQELSQQTHQNTRSLGSRHDLSRPSSPDSAQSNPEHQRCRI